MKPLKTIILFLFFTILITSCSGDEKKNANFLPPLKIEIPNDIKGNTELVDVIKSCEKSINEFSNNIEQLAMDGKDVLTKEHNKEELGMMDKIKAGKLMLDFASNSTQMVMTMKKYKTFMDRKKEQGDITENELKTLEMVAKKFKDRIDEIDEKYKDYFDK